MEAATPAIVALAVTVFVLACALVAALVVLQRTLAATLQHNRSLVSELVRLGAQRVGHQMLQDAAPRVIERIAEEKAAAPEHNGRPLFSPVPPEMDGD